MTMTLKLFEVKTTAYVVAEDEYDALFALCQAGELSPDPGSTVEIEEADGVDPEWHDVEPYGDDPGERTCGEIIKQIIAAEEANS